MSAFVCSDNHLSTILLWVKSHNEYDNKIWIELGENEGSFLYINKDNDLRKIGQILLNENVKAVNFRYSEHNQPHDFCLQEEFFAERNLKYLSAVQILKLLDCYEYQSSEDDNYEKSNAYNIILFVRKLVIKFLPGYNKAEWYID